MPCLRVGLGQPLLQRRKFRVHVGEDSSDGLLLIDVGDG